MGYHAGRPPLSAEERGRMVGEPAGTSFADCAYCDRFGPVTRACDGCGGSSWGPLLGGIVSDPGPLPLHGCVMPSLGTPHFL